MDNNKWIPVDDALPEPYTSVLTIEDDCYRIAYIGEFWERREDVRYVWCIPGQTYTPNITHWMPLPEKPEKVNR